VKEDSGKNFKYLYSNGKEGSIFATNNFRLFKINCIIEQGSSNEVLILHQC